MNIEKIDKIFDKTTQKSIIHEAVLLVENTQGDFSYSRTYGERNLDSPLLMASITKLLTSACVFILKEQGKLSLDDFISMYFPDETLKHLHTYKGKEFTSKLTIYHLLCQTSGLPDAFEEGKDSFRKQVIEQDFDLTLEEMVKMTQQLPARFAPNLDKRAHYADVNYDLLGRIIENIMDLPLEDVYQQFIFDPLNLKNTYLPISEDDDIPNVYVKNASLYRPKFIRGCRASGGAISTARELMIFLKAFFGGKLFKKAVFEELPVNNRLQMTMYPIHYGAGYMRIPLGGLGTMFMGKGELIGHSGSTGSFAFYYQRKDIFIVGDINQMASPAVPIPMKIAMTLK